MGYGVGGPILVPVIPKMLEAQFSGKDGSLTANPETMFLAGIILHAWPGLDLDAYAGEEYESRNFGFTPQGTNNFVGLGNPVSNNSGCAVELSTLCSGNVREVKSITGGFWQDIYKGPFGEDWLAAPTSRNTAFRA